MTAQRKARGALRKVCAWSTLVLLIVSGTASAQVIQLSGGSSSLLEAQGGSFELHSEKYVGRFDLGLTDQLRIGFSLATPYRGWNWTLGDQTFPFVLPTDLFNGSYYFLGRGVSAEHHGDRGRLLVYGGTTSLGYYTPFLSLARSERGVGLVFYERQLSRTTKFYSYNIFSSQQTSLQGIDWAPRKGLKLATSAGMGSNQGYWSGSLNFDRNWISAQGGYTHTGDAFRRVRVQAPLVTETSGGNFRVQLRPLQNLAFTLSRHNYLKSDPRPAVGAAASVDSLGVYASASGFRFNSAIYDSHTTMSHAQGFTLGVQRSIAGRVEVGSNLFQSHVGGFKQRSISVRLRETLNRRLALSQVISQSNGHTTLGFGGNFTSNWFTIGLEHQTLFFPLADATHSPFRQVLMLNLQLRLPHDIQVYGASNVDATGRARYTGYATSFLYPNGSGRDGRGTGRGLPEYIVRGIVLDDRGNPIQGAALRVDGRIVFTNSQGVFLLSVKKAKMYPLEVHLDQFMFPGWYEVVSAPVTVEGGGADTAKLCEVILRRVAPPQPVLTATSTASPNQAPN
jgi:hypothetical protein